MHINLQDIVTIEADGNLKPALHSPLLRLDPKIP